MPNAANSGESHLENSARTIYTPEVLFQRSLDNFPEQKNELITYSSMDWEEDKIYSQADVSGTYWSNPVATF